MGNISQTQVETAGPYQQNEENIVKFSNYILNIDEKNEWIVKDKKIIDYLNSRWYGTNDWIHFHKNTLFDKKEFFESLNFNTEKPYVLLLTNVMWDAQLHYPMHLILLVCHLQQQFYWLQRRQWHLRIAL